MVKSVATLQLLHRYPQGAERQVITGLQNAEHSASLVRNSQFAQKLISKVYAYTSGVELSRGPPVAEEGPKENPAAEGALAGALC